VLDSLTAYKVRPAPELPPSRFETGTGNFEGMCGVVDALEYIEWVGETFRAEHAERFAGEYSGRLLSFKLGMSTIRSFEYELSRALLDILAETLGVTIYGIQDTRRLEERLPTSAFTLACKNPHQVASKQFAYVYCIRYEADLFLGNHDLFEPLIYSVYRRFKS